MGANYDLGGLKPMLSALRRKWSEDLFHPTFLSFFMNPSYITRRGLHKSIARIAPNITGNVLDFGCGSKPYRSLFARAETYIGVDIEVSGHDHQDSQVDIFYDGNTLPFPDDNFDAVVCFEVMEHLFNLQAILQEIGRVLRPGGSLLISIPFAWPEHEQPYDFARYTTFGIRSILEESGFSVEQVEKTSSANLAISQLRIATLYESIMPLGALGVFLRPMILVPMHMRAFLLNFILPKNDAIYAGLVILSRRSGTP